MNIEPCQMQILFLLEIWSQFSKLRRESRLVCQKNFISQTTYIRRHLFPSSVRDLAPIRLPQNIKYSPLPSTSTILSFKCLRIRHTRQIAPAELMDRNCNPSEAIPNSLVNNSQVSLKPPKRFSSNLQQAMIQL